MAKKEKKEKQENQMDGTQLWKMVGIFALVFTAVQLAAGALKAGIEFLMDTVGAGENMRVFLGSTLSHAGIAAIVFLITVPVIRSILKQPVTDSLYPRKGRSWLDLFVGMGISAAAMLIIFGISSVLGFISISGFALSGNGGVVWLRTIWLALLANAITAMSHEVLFRGLLLQSVEIGWDKWGALFVSSIIFGGVQIFTAGAASTNWLKLVPLMALPGVMLGWATLRTGNLWLATGIHFAWNLFQHDILNMTGSRQGETLFGLMTKISGPKWLTGTFYGIETSLAGVLCLLLVSVGIWWWTGHSEKKNNPA